MTAVRCGQCNQLVTSVVIPDRSGTEGTYASWSQHVEPCGHEAAVLFDFTDQETT